MARAFSLAQLTTRALQLADKEVDGQIGASVSTTIASGSNGAVLPQSIISLTSTTGLNASGGAIGIAISGATQIVYYSGVGGSTITGCVGGTGTLATGQAVASLSEATDAINAGVAYVWNELVRSNPEQYSSDFDINTVAGQESYALPSDFRSLAALYSIEASDGSRRPVQPVNMFDRAYFKTPTAVYNMVLDYIPTASTLVFATDFFDGICGFEEIVAAHAARRFLQKEEADVSIVQGILSEWRASLGQNFRTRGGPRFLSDLDAIDARIYPTTIGIRGYRIRGANIELYEPVLPLMVLPS